MEEIYCNKCGKKYDGSLSKCPECGEPNSKLFKKKTINVVKYFIFGVLAGCVIATLVISVFNYKKISDLSAKFDALTMSGDTSVDSSTAVNLSDYTFYDEYLLTDTKLPDKKDYFIYFHSDTCSYCVAYGNSYILTYYNIPVSEDSDNYIYDEIPVYFAEAGTEAGDLIAEQFGIESTPSIIRIHNGEVVAMGDGYEEVYELVGDVVNSYYGE